MVKLSPCLWKYYDKRVHTALLTLVQVQGWGGGGAGWWNPSPEFLQYFETICLKWKAFDLSNKIGNILWLVALLEAFEINKTMVIILTTILDFTKN